MPRFVTCALRTVHRYNTAPELIDFAILSAINATLCLRSGDNARRRCERDSCSRPDRMVGDSPTLAVRCRAFAARRWSKFLKVLFTNLATTARSAAEGGSMLVMNVPGRRAQRLQRLVNFAVGLLA
jgi:hypothetical protein